MDSHQRNARVTDINPKRTSCSIREVAWLSSMKSRAALTMGLHPQSVISGSAKKHHLNFPITQHSSDGNVRWGINIDDVSLQEGAIDLEKWGIKLQEDILPTAHFELIGNSQVPGVPDSPPKCMDIAIISYWKLILPSKPKSSWIQRLLHSFKPEFRLTGNTQTTSYSNLFQIVALTANLSDLIKPSNYKATVPLKLRSGVSDFPDVKQYAEDSVYVTPEVVVDGM